MKPLLFAGLACVSIAGAVQSQEAPAPASAPAQGKEKAPAPTQAAEEAPKDPAKDPAKGAAAGDAKQPAKDASGTPQRFIPSEQVRSDFDVSFPVDI